MLELDREDRASQVTLVVTNVPASAGDARDAGLTPGSGRSFGGGQGNLLQDSCLQNPLRQRSLAGYSLRGHKESDVTEHTTQREMTARSKEKVEHVFLHNLFHLR